MWCAHLSVAVGCSFDATKLQARPRHDGSLAFDATTTGEIPPGDTWPSPSSRDSMTASLLDGADLDVLTDTVSAEVPTDQLVTEGKPSEDSGASDDLRDAGPNDDATIFLADADLLGPIDLWLENPADVSDGPGAQDGVPTVAETQPGDTLVGSDVLGGLQDVLSAQDAFDAVVRLDVAQDAAAEASPDQSVNCATRIIANGYQAGTAPPCSACRDNNGVVLATKCEDMIDCLATRTTPYLYDCLNAVSGSSFVYDCAFALTKAAGCPTAYY